MNRSGMTWWITFTGILVMAWVSAVALPRTLTQYYGLCVAGWVYTAGVYAYARLIAEGVALYLKKRRACS